MYVAIHVHCESMTRLLSSLRNVLQVELFDVLPDESYVVMARSP